MRRFRKSRKIYDDCINHRRCNFFTKEEQCGDMPIGIMRDNDNNADNIWNNSVYCNYNVRSMIGHSSRGILFQASAVYSSLCQFLV